MWFDNRIRKLHFNYYFYKFYLIEYFFFGGILCWFFISLASLAACQNVILFRMKKYWAFIWLISKILSFLVSCDHTGFLSSRYHVCLNFISIQFLFSICERTISRIVLYKLWTVVNRNCSPFVTIFNNVTSRQFFKLIKSLILVYFLVHFFFYKLL